MNSHRDNRETEHEDDDHLDTHPQTLRDGRKRLVGRIDGFATYYDTRRHRIDVRLERFDGTYHMTGYYQLQKDESVAAYVRTAREHGATCAELSDWVEDQLQSDRSLTAGWRQSLSHRIDRLVRSIQ